MRIALFHMEATTTGQHSGDTVPTTGFQPNRRASLAQVKHQVERPIEAPSPQGQLA